MPIFDLNRLEGSSPGVIRQAALSRLDEIVEKKGPAPSQQELFDLERTVEKHASREYSQRLHARLHGGGDFSPAPAAFHSAADAHRYNSAIQTKGIASATAPLVSPMDLSRGQWEDAFETVAKRKSWRGEVKTKAALTAGGMALPAVVDPSLTLAIGYEPDRLFAHFPNKVIDYPTVEYYAHTANTNPAAVVAELGTKPDLGMQLTAKTATATKIAAVASASMEALSDFDTFQMFIPGELTRAVIDAETAWVAAQLLATSGVLTRAKGSSEAPLDTLLGAFNDLRVGAAYTEPNLIAMHPTTWTYLRSQKNGQGEYLLGTDPGDEQRKQLWGVTVVTNTRIAVGTAIVANTGCVQGWTRTGMTIDSDGGYSASNFTTNAVTFRAEERITIGVLKPAGVDIVTGLVAA